MDIITVKDAMKITGLSQSTIITWAKRKDQGMIGKGMYMLSPDFIDFLKTLKPRNRKVKHAKVT